MENTSFDLRNVFGLLRRQLRLIAITVLVIMAVASVVIFTLTPVFTASTLVLVDTSRKNLLDPESQLIGGGDSNRIDSEVEILRSSDILLQVARSENLVADPEFGVSLSTRARLLAWLRIAEPTLPTGEEALSQTLSRLRSAITVQRRGFTYLIAIQVRSENPETAARIANAMAEAYIEDQLAAKIDGTLASRDILQTRVAAARQDIVDSDRAFDAFIQANIEGIVRDSGRTDIALMQQQIAELQAARQQSLATADLVQQRLDAGDYGAIANQLQSDALAELERQRAELAAAVSRTGADSPVIVDLRQQLADIETRLKDQAQAEVATLRSALTGSETQEETLRQSVRSAVLASQLSADTLAELYELQQNAELARSQYQTLLARVNDLDTQASLQVADSRIVSLATAPSAPSFPNTTFLLGISLLAAFATGVGLAFLYENYVGGFTTDAQLESMLHVPVASTIPRTRPKGNSDGALADMMVDAPLSVFAEGVRRIRAAVNLAMRDSRDETASEGIVLMVSSTAPGEGKSTMAVSIARSYALAGQSVMLIDGDLRKPTIHKMVGLEPSRGLMEYLGGDGAADDLTPFITRDSVTDTTILPGAHRSGVPTDQLVSSRTFQRLIQASKRSFDVVVIDTPPIAPVVDGQYIASLADVIVFVVRWATTSQTDVREALSRLSRATRPGVPTLVVLNQQDKSEQAYRGKYGEYYVQPA